VLVRIALIDDVVVMDLQGADGTADWRKYLLITDAGEGHRSRDRNVSHVIAGVCIAITAPLKLRPYGAIEICLLLLLLFFLYPR